MKVSYLVFIFSVVTCIACSCTKNKKEAVVIVTPKPVVAGEWRWIETFEGWAGDTIRPDIDSVVVLKLTNDSSFFVYLNQHLNGSGTFSSSGSDGIMVLHFNSHIQANKLKMRDDAAIGYIINDTCRLYDYNISDANSHIFTRKP
jgi:hypothetical protein